MLCQGPAWALEVFRDAWRLVIFPISFSSLLFFCFQSLKEQKVEIKSFAEFIIQLEKVKSKVPALKEKVEHSKNLFEVRTTLLV
jgi:hypothetical protein